MMNIAVDFWYGLVWAGFIGLFSTLIVMNWAGSNKTIKRIFSDIPQPTLDKEGQVKTNITDSPLQIVLQKSVEAMMQFLLLAFLLIILGLIMWFGFPEESTVDHLLGILFAALFGFLGRHLFKNWKEISNLYKKIVNPPTPGADKAAPPNKHYLNTKSSQPAFTIVVNGLIGITARSILQLALLFFMTQTLAVTLSYGFNSTFQILTPATFNI